LKPEKWSPVLANVSKIKADYCYRNKIPICSEKETASTEDRMSLGTVCFWEGTYDGAEMSHFCNTAVNLAGRSSDISDSDLSDLRTVKKRVGVSTYNLIEQKTTRFKTTTQKDHTIVPHRESFILCYYFSLAYLLVMNGDKISRGDQKLFPTFASKVFNKDGKIESKTSDHFNKTIDFYYKIIYDFYGGKFVQILISSCSHILTQCI
jgi:hypothetical protein